MKKLLAVLSVISVMGPSSLAMTRATTKINHSPQSTKYVIDSFKNIVKVFNWQWKHDERLDLDLADLLISGFPWNIYEVSVDKKSWDEGTVFELSSIPRNDTRTIKSYEDKYTNRTSSKQIARTQSRTEKVTETHEFSINLIESITSVNNTQISGKIKFPNVEIEGGVSFGFTNETANEKNWREIKTLSVEETIPSQELNQNPYTILHVKYLVKQSTIDYTGLAQFRINNLTAKNVRIPFFYFNSEGDILEMFWETFSINDIVKTLKDEGYGAQIIKNQNNQFSVLTVDNIDNPQVAYLNLPVTWSSPNSIIDLEYYEEKILQD